MFVHFMFEALRDEPTTDRQTHEVIEEVLDPRRLRISPCWEFIPAFNPGYGNPNAKAISPDSWRPFKSGIEATLNTMKFEPMAPVTYAHMNVFMICFIAISFKKLRASYHYHQYGKFGLALTSDFLKSKGIKSVKYYTEDSVWKDPAIIKWNKDQLSNELSDDERSAIVKEIIRYRKPASMFPSFTTQVGLKLSRGSESPVSIEYYKYDRYKEGYDFRKENEYRIVFNEDQQYMSFDETDVEMIITPDESSSLETVNYLSSNWHSQPSVIVYPT